MPNDKIEEINRALEAATQGEWVTGVCSAKDALTRTQYHHMVTLPTSTLVIAFTGPYGEERSAKDAHLIANAPKWLRWQQAEIERLSSDREFWMNLYNQERDLCKGQKEYLRDINERISADADRLLEENERLRGELEQLQEDRHQNAADMFAQMHDDLEMAKVERDDYRKVLEWYGGGSEDGGEKARDVILRYKRGDRADG